MNEPHDPNATADLPALPAESLATDHAYGSTSTAGPPGRDRSAGELPAIPGYRVVREIARGGMGRVLTAFDLGLEREVALKVLLPGAAADRFVRESKIAARLPHPGIPPVHALGALADGSPFLAMKLIAGQTLAAEIKTADRPRLLQAFAQVCQAVGFAHSRGVIHRDLKPANVMVGAFGEVQVMDWGLAKDLTGREVPGASRSDAPIPLPAAAGPDRTTDHGAAGESTDEQTRAGQVMGTPAYMAPEQARGEPTDARADVFALGGILCAILTGQPPFLGKSAAEVVRRAAAGELGDAFTRLDGCRADAELVALCRRCLSPSPADRPPAGQAVADGLTAYLDGVRERLRATEVARAAEAARAEEATRTAAEANERARAERRARRVQVVAASLLLVVLAGGIVGTSVGLLRADRAKTRAETAEGETKARAEELQKVADYQAKMLQQIDPADAGVKLMADLRARFAAALEKSKVPEAEKAARTASFERELSAVNATDAAVALLDRTVLAPATRTIETQFADQPLVDARLRTTLGGVYDTLGRPKEALALFRQGYELRVKLLGEDHPDTLAAHSGVGKALGELQQLPEAERAVRAALEGYQRVLGEDHNDTLVAKGLLVSQLDYQGKYDECEALSRDILERRRRVQGPDHVDTLHAMNDLGRFLMNQGKYADAVKLLREVLEAQRRVADPAVAATLGNLGSALNRQKEYAAAEPYYREALMLQRRALGEDHPNTVGDINNLAALLMEMGKLEEAEPLARESLEKCRRIHGNEHANTLKSMNVMGQVLFRQNKFAETEPYYREALATGRRVLGEDHPDTIIFIANLGFLMQRLGRTAEAEAYRREALDKNRRRLGDTHPYTLVMLKGLVDFLRQQGKPGEAEGYLREVLETVRRVEGEDHPETLALIGTLGAVLRDQGKLAEAEPFFQQALEKNRQQYGGEHANTITAILRMASLNVAQGKNAEAVALLTPIRDKVRSAIPGTTGVLRHASLLGLLGMARTGLAKHPADFTSAAADLLAAHATFAQTRGEKDKETRDWVQGLADLYSAWDKAEPGNGYDAKAAAWRAKLPRETAPRPRERK